MLRLSASIAIALGILLSSASLPAQSPEPVQGLHAPFDQLLDLNVRDGLVYYRALKSERGRLDRYVASLNVPATTVEAWSRDEKLAFWLNAYNALVLQTVIGGYPIRGKFPDYPPSSVRQIPGAFERTKHRVAGRTLTLDEIEKNVLPEFKEPRAYLALGRGAVGSGRLRSEAYTAARLSAQLAAMQAEMVTQQEMVRIDRLNNRMSVTPIISWHEAEFVATYDRGDGAFAGRSAIERAILSFVMPHLLRLEREFAAKNAFQIAFHPFDWRLNDLSGGRVD